MSFENKKVKRIFSAKISSSNQRQRPFSGSSGTYTRNQLINTIYNQDQILHLSQRATSAKNLPAKIVQQVQKSKKIVVKQSKKKEEMQNQIMHLKKTINQLVQQLQLQKGKTQSLRKKSHKFSKILTAEYENQVHWNSNTLNTHLIAGIKNQYQNLKQKCQQLSQQNQKIKKQSSFTKQLEYITYIQKLENENKCLVNKIKRLSSGSIQILTNNQSQRMATDYIISEIESQNRKLYQKNNELKGKYKMCRDNLKDRDNKIAILEKLAIQKDNNYHALQKKQANTKKQIIYIKEKLQSMTKDYQILQSQYTKRTHLLQRQLQTRQNNYTQKLSQTLNEKNYKIGILERQSLYFQNMVKELRSTNTQLNHQVQNAKMMKTTDRAIMSLINMNYEEQNARNQKEQEKNNAADLFLKEALFFMKNNKGVYENNKRIPQKANKKYNESALKKRRVSLNQIQQIVQFLKLKLLSKKIHIQSLLQLFTHKSSKNQWQIEYINMQQIRTILQSELINIPSQQSLLLARYLIEDVNEEYVYCDQNNQNNRQIVKSIIRSLVKDIDRIVQNQIYQKQAQIVMNNYRDKIRANLQTVEPTGYVSKRRFLDILKGIGAECSSEAQEILLARLAAHSNCITKLSYQQTFKTL